MQCPVDGTTLVMSERQQVEIDYCPQCRGIWLDRGELDKLLERAARDDDADDRYRGGDRDRYERPDRPDRPDRPERYDDDRHHRPPKRKKWLSEMFDFD
jgi:Zn-finger nucleic acid-binding protein